jgi:prepilin-type N-terminal cleavage/methylation domain-containing protein
MKLIKKNQGFTLIELLVVIGVLAVLLTITLVAINPQRQFQLANDAKRQSDVNAVLDAVVQYSADNKGALPVGIGTSAMIISSTSGASYINLCSALVPKYIADLPVDPTLGTKSPASSICSDSGATYSTGYSISKSATNNRVTVVATPEQATSISVTR